MTKEDAKDYIREWCPYDKQDEIIKALEQEPIQQEPCGDAKSRLAKLDCLIATGFKKNSILNAMGKYLKTTLATAAESEYKENQLRAVSGMTIDEIIDAFCQGYTLTRTAPEYRDGSWQMLESEK